MTNSILYIILNRQDGRHMQFVVEYSHLNLKESNRMILDLSIHHHSIKNIEHIIEWVGEEIYDSMYEACVEYEKLQLMGDPHEGERYVCVRDYHVGGMQWMTEKQFDRLLFAEKFI